MAVDATVRVCSVCRGTAFRRYGLQVIAGDDQATEFAECQQCGATYLYKRPAPPRAPSERM